jgi:putative nucleotidyltransferase with HDIG domain
VLYNAFSQAMNTLFRVFLCSTFTDLTDERKSVLEAIRRLQLQHDSMEFFGARAKLPIKTCLEEVRKSDVLVVVVGHRYGNLVPGRDVSFAEAEYREGHRLRKPCLVYVRDENVPVLPKNVERDSEKARLLDKWKATLMKRHTMSSFTGAPDLAIQVTADLSRTINILEPEVAPSQRASNRNVSSAVARTQHVSQAMTDLERSYDITLEALGDALDLRDAESEGHSKRVTAYTIALGRAMGLSGENLRPIARGAFLHDIGKMATSDAILHKPGALTPEETQIMREHCFRGYQMLKKIPFLAEAAEIVYTHHERYDGAGYPRGLSGSNIPLGARIFSIADTLDAITSDRPYRVAQPIAKAREEIQRLSGSQFDPAVVRIFLLMPPAIWEDLRKEISSQIYRFTYPIRVVRADSEPFHGLRHSSTKGVPGLSDERCCTFCGNGPTHTEVLIDKNGKWICNSCLAELQQRLNEDLPRGQ